MVGIEWLPATGGGAAICAMAPERQRTGKACKPCGSMKNDAMLFPMHPDLELAGRVIRSHLAGRDARVRLFGSRTRGDSCIWSDIDVAIQASPALPAGMLSALREALEESSCLVDWNDTGAALRESIGREGIDWSV